MRIRHCDLSRDHTGELCVCSSGWHPPLLPGLRQVPSAQCGLGWVEPMSFMQRGPMSIFRLESQNPESWLTPRTTRPVLHPQLEFPLQGPASPHPLVSGVFPRRGHSTAWPPESVLGPMEGHDEEADGSPLCKAAANSQGHQRLAASEWCGSPILEGCEKTTHSIGMQQECSRMLGVHLCA